MTSTTLHKAPPSDIHHPCCPLLDTLLWLNVFFKLWCPKLPAEWVNPLLVQLTMLCLVPDAPQDTVHSLGCQGTWQVPGNLAPRVLDAAIKYLLAIRRRKIKMVPDTKQMHMHSLQLCTIPLLLGPLILFIFHVC